MRKKQPDYDRLAAELVRAMRGRRSAAALSRLGGYRSNVVLRWEHGQAWPTAARFFGLCVRLRVDVDRSVSTFLGSRPSWLDTSGFATKEGVAALLRDLRGQSPFLQLASRTGINRYTLSRWMNATAEPKLPQLLALVDALSRRLPDFIATLVDPSALPSMRRRWQKLSASRRVAYDEPLSHGVLRALELSEYKERGFRQAAWLEKKLGMSSEEVERCLRALSRAGQVRRTRQRWIPVSVERVDTRSDPEGAKAIKLAWTELAIDRMRADAPGAYGFSLFAVGREDMKRLRKIHLDYVRAMQSVIAQSENTSCVGLYCAQLLDLDSTSGNALT